jgi:hypothetical protein
MTLLFRRINPAQKFRITKHQIAKFLRIPKSQIVKIECWLYVIFVHRRDQGGQFISYREIEQWKNAVASQLQKCSTNQQLQHLWNAIEYDHIKHNKQYANFVLSFLKEIFLAVSSSFKPALLSTPLDRVYSNVSAHYKAQDASFPFGKASQKKSL